MLEVAVSATLRGKITIRQKPPKDVADLMLTDIPYKASTNTP